MDFSSAKATFDSSKKMIFSCPLHQFKYALTRYDRSNIDEIAHALVNGSEFPIATALSLAAFFRNLASEDFSSDIEIREIADNYSSIALNLLNEIESDHLGMTLED